jgi:beta-glucosidase
MVPRQAYRVVFARLGFIGIAVTLLCWCLPALAQAPKGDSKPGPGRPWMDKNMSPDRRADLLLQQMTLDEKVTLVHGLDDPRPRNWLGGAGFAPGVPRLGIPDVQSTDGRSGVGRAGQQGRYATALPSTLALAASFDLRLAHDYGALMGKECRQLGFQISLGATANLVREPRNGRNFECLGEDPLLIGKMLARELRATQEQGVVANINRYALNDQETSRAGPEAYNVVMDKRTMRETDLLAFEIAIKESEVGTVMGAYNRVNGVYCCDSGYLLGDLLKKTWGFKGWVMSDWGATSSTVKSVLAGFDQEMPGGGFLGEPLKRAVEKGEVPMARLDDMVHRILRTEFAVGVFDRPAVLCAVNPFTGAEVAQRVAQQSIVLLKNAGGLLPLEASGTASIAVIGSHADAGVLSGGGSDQVDPAGGNAVAGQGAVWHPSSPLKAIRAKACRAKVEYDPGTDVARAAKLASGCGVAVVFVHQHTSEGSDVPNLSLPGKQDELVGAVAAANPHTIVVLETGGPVTMPWIDKVSAAVEAWYPGIRGGEAIAGVLFGDVSPSARLPVTFPKTEADLPEVKLPGPPPPGFDIHYAEGLKVGYKWFDAEGKEPLFPFGFGLSYASYTYSDLRTTVGKRVQMSFKVANTGKRAGAEIAQVYVSLPAAAGEPPKRLVAWEKINLLPGQAKTVTLTIDPLYLSIFNADKDQWELLPGQYVFFVGGSSRSTPLHEAVTLGSAP